MNIQIIQYLACALMFVNIGMAVVRPNVHRQHKLPDSRPETNTPNITHHLRTSESEYLLNHVTAHYCCKVGESLVRKLNSCRPDTTTNTNTRIKGMWSSRPKASAILSAELSRCQNQQHVVRKCCDLRFQYVRALNSCKIRNTGHELQECRRKARRQYRVRGQSAR